MLTNIRNMPIGIQTFEDIVCGNYAYVDKTAYVYTLAKTGKPYFLGRPRRFGKSLLLSTLNAYFSGRKELFEGLHGQPRLAIADLEKDWIAHPVFHLDLNTGNYTSVDELKLTLDGLLQQIEKKLEYKDIAATLATRFLNIIRYAYEKTGQKVVVLIDEYDTPLVQNLDNEQLSDDIRKELKAFYGVLKTADPYLQFVFLTGVTKFSKVSIFSELNQLRDISMLDEFSGICGITETELTSNFTAEIQELANTSKASYDETLALLRKNYNGYHFTEESEGVFNPFSVINTFANRKISYYWFSTGTPTFLVKQLKNANFDIRELSEGIKINAQSITDYRPPNGNPVALLYQTGYLTITGYNAKTRVYTLSFPNEEVKYGFLDELLPFYVPLIHQGESFFVLQFLEDLQRNDLDGFMKRLQACLASIPYDITTNFTTEQHYQYALYVLFTFLGQFAEAEVRSSEGRADLVVKTDATIYVFEFKLNTGQGKAYTVDDALRQIDEKGYLIPFQADGRQLVKVGVVFDAEKHNIGQWKNVEKQ